MRRHRLPRLGFAKYSILHGASDALTNPNGGTIIMQTQAQTTNLATVAVLVSHAVESYETWKRAFDGHAAARRNAGVVATHINRSADNANLISVYLAATDAAKLDAFLSSADLKETMKGAGVVGAPQIAKITPMEDLTVKDRSLPAAIVRHEVSDYPAWKRAFDGHAEARARAGIIGHAVNVSAENSKLVIVYLQAESHDALRAFASAPEVKDVMKAAGVVGAPEISFVNGGGWDLAR